MTFTEIILAFLPFIALALIIFILAKWGEPITWLDDLGRYPVSKKRTQQKPKPKTYHINISINKADE